MRVYGKPDPDSAAYDALMLAVGDATVTYIMHHPRVPIDARPCQLPTSLMVQAVLVGGKVVTARQLSVGGRINITET